jgi:hypothetical protein
MRQATAHCVATRVSENTSLHVCTFSVSLGYPIYPETLNFCQLMPNTPAHKANELRMPWVLL